MTFQPQFTPSKHCARGQMFPFPPWLRHCLQDRIISLLHVMHTAKYLEVEASYKNCHTDICSKQNRSCTCSEILNPVPYSSKHSIQSYAALPVAVANASKPQLLQSLSQMLSFYRTNVKPIDQVKSNLS